MNEKNFKSDNKIILVFLLIIVFFLFSSFTCSKVNLKECPYSICGELFFNRNGINTGFEILIENNSEKPFEQFTIIFSLFDEDGEPVFDSNWVSINVEKTIFPDETYSYIVNIEDFLNIDEEQNLMLDYLYLSKIAFFDKKVWEDPFGLYAVD